MALIAEYGYVNTDLISKYVKSSIKVPVITPKRKPVKVKKNLLEIGKEFLFIELNKLLNKEKQKLYKQKQPVFYAKPVKKKKESLINTRTMLILGGLGMGALAIYLLRR